ncbi:MAG: transglutaminase family protein, partial [Bdellovibrionales bacterium]
DKAMVDEPGRNTIETPYKWSKSKEFSFELARALDLPVSAVSVKESWKKGYYLNVPGDGKWVINPEPVTIEVNTTPRRIGDLIETSSPIFKVAQGIGLVPYVQPAAERSGMGHIHVGARNMAENPFFLHPQLLRNVMVYLHKNPALLHGFAEAFDIGLGSNIETYHDEKRQKVFMNAVQEFDLWFMTALPQERANGLNKFLQILAKHDSGVGFFAHYRFINLEHLIMGASLGFSAEDSGKLTVEFRNFRPPLNSKTTHAFAELLLSILNLQSKNGHLEPFEWIPQDEYLRFNSATRVLENWKKVKIQLGLLSPELEFQIQEYVKALDISFAPIKNNEITVKLAYSQKNRKGEFFEILINKDKALHHEPPVLVINGQVIELKNVQLDSSHYWHAVIDIVEYGLKKEDMNAERFFKLIEKYDNGSSYSCRKAVGL